MWSARYSAMGERDDVALRCVQDQRRRLQRGECVAHIDLQKRSPQRPGCPRSEGRTPLPRQQLHELFVLGQIRRDKLDQLGRPPLRSEGVEDRLSRFDGEPDRVVVANDQAGRRVAQHQGTDPIRVGRGKQDCDRPGVGLGVDRRVLRSDGIEDRQDVLGGLLPRRDRVEGHGVRGTGPPTVEEDQATERCQIAGGTVPPSPTGTPGDYRYR